MVGQQRFVTIGITSQWASWILQELIFLNDGKEPIDGFDLCRKDLLLSALKSPFQRGGKRDKKEDFIEKASRVFYSMIINHCLPTNGNKRFSLQILLVMALLNDFKIKTSDEDIYELSKTIVFESAESRDKRKVISKIENFLEDNLVEIEPRFSKRERVLLVESFQDFLMKRE